MEFSAFNGSWKIAPLTAGCTVVMKPLTNSVVSARLMEIIHDSGLLPKGVLNMVTGFGEEAGAPLAEHPMVDKVAFTGSTEVGKIITKGCR